jgi:hypothetical protein
MNGSLITVSISSKQHQYKTFRIFTKSEDIYVINKAHCETNVDCKFVKTALPREYFKQPEFVSFCLHGQRTVVSY